MGRLVVKFGGTSVGSVGSIRAAVDITLEQFREWGEVACVVSAMNGVTDGLLRGAQSAARGDPSVYHAVAQTLRERHRAALQALAGNEADFVSSDVYGLIGEFELLCASVAVLGELTPRDSRPRRSTRPM